MKSTNTFFLSLCAVMCIAISQANAASMHLSDLLVDGETFLVGDKLFSHFTYAGTEDMPAADAINVISIQDADGNYGLRLQGGFLDLPGGSTSDALITYRVTASAPGKLISDAHLTANLVTPVGGLGTVNETFLPQLADPNDGLYVSTDTALVDWMIFDQPLKSLDVQKNVLLRAGDAAASVSFIDQTFSQVPEPTSIALAFLGFISSLVLRQRRTD